MDKHDVYYDQESECWFCCTCDAEVCSDSGEGMDEEADRPTCPNEITSQAS